jgi:hypothetical protein
MQLVEARSALTRHNIRLAGDRKRTVGRVSLTKRCHHGADAVPRRSGFACRRPQRVGAAAKHGARWPRSPLCCVHTDEECGAAAQAFLPGGQACRRIAGGPVCHDRRRKARRSDRDLVGVCGMATLYDRRRLAVLGHSGAAGPAASRARSAHGCRPVVARNSGVPPARRRLLFSCLQGSIAGSASSRTSTGTSLPIVLTERFARSCASGIQTERCRLRENLPSPAFAGSSG